MKTTMLHLRLEDDACESLDKLAGKALNRQSVARMLLIAAIEAVQANDGMIQLPPKFAVENKTLVKEISYRLNEPKARK